MKTTIKFPNLTFEVPYNIGDILLFTDTYGSESVDTVCEISIHWNREKGAWVDGIYGKHDYSLSEHQGIKEVLRAGKWEMPKQIIHSEDLTGRIIAFKDSNRVLHQKMTFMGVHLRDDKVLPYKRYYGATGGHDVDIDGEYAEQYLVLTKEQSKIVEKWLKKE